MIKNLIRKVRILQNHIRFFCKRFKRKQKLVLVTHSSEKTGAPLLALNIAKNIHTRDICLVIVTLSQGELDCEFKKASDYYLIKPSSLELRFLYKKGFDRLLINSIASTTILKSSFIDSRFKIICLVHEMPGAILKNNLLENVDFLYKKCETVVFPSTFTKNRFESRFGLLPIRTTIRSQGLFNRASFQVDRSSGKQFVFDNYGISVEKNILLAVGTGDERKGIDLFISLAEMMKFDSRFFFVWIGPIVDKKINKSKIQNCLNNIAFIEYISNFDSLAHFYDASTFYLMLSREEPFGSVVLEAFSRELPVVAFENGGGFLDVVHNNLSGFLTEFCNLNKVKNVILDNFDNKMKLKTICENAKAIVQNLDFNSYIDYLLKLFE